MKGRQVLSYAETLPHTTPILSSAQTRWLLVGHVRRFLQFLAVLGLIVFYLVSRGPAASTHAVPGSTRGRNMGALLRLPERETTLLSFTLWRGGVAPSGDDVLSKLAKDPTLAAFLGNKDHELNVYRSTNTVPSIMRVLGIRTGGGHSRNKVAGGGKMMNLLGWSVDERPLHAVTRTKAINNFKETYRISA